MLQQTEKKLQVKISTLKKKENRKFFIQHQKRETRDMIEATAILENIFGFLSFLFFKCNLCKLLLIGIA